MSMLNVAPGILVKSAAPASAAQALATLAGMRLPGRLHRFLAPTLVGGALGGLGGYYLTPPESDDRRLTNTLIGAGLGAGAGMGVGWLRRYRSGVPTFSHNDNAVLMRQNEVKPWLGVPQRIIGGTEVADPTTAYETALHANETLGQRSMPERALNYMAGLVDE